MCITHEMGKIQMLTMIQKRHAAVSYVIALREKAN
jgi:hypothetical protein